MTLGPARDGSPCALAQRAIGSSPSTEDPELLAELERRADGLPVQTVCADARDFRLPGRTFPLIIAPMQTIQLLGGAAATSRSSTCARRHLSAGGVAGRSPSPPQRISRSSSGSDGDHLPLPDIAELDGSAYFSQPTAVGDLGTRSCSNGAGRPSTPEGTRTSSEDRIALDIVSVQHFRRPARARGLRPLDVREIAPSEEHIGSRVVILGG